MGTAIRISDSKAQLRLPGGLGWDSLELCTSIVTDVAESWSAGDGGSSFCPHCGAPQLYLPEQAGHRLPKRALDRRFCRRLDPQQVEWKTAILCAVAVAAGGGGAERRLQHGCLRCRR